jgi:prevent-host-death family protein
MPKTKRNEGIVVSAVLARHKFGKLLRRVEDEGRSLAIEKRGTPRAVLLSIRDYVRLAAPEPKVLAIIGDACKVKGTATLNSRQIDGVIRAVPDKRPKRR